MKTATTAASTLLLALLLSLTAMLGIAASVESPPSLMSRADHLAALQGLADAARLELARSRHVPDAHDRAVCRAQARAAERVAVASLDARYLGTVSARDRARRVQARAEHSIAVARRLLPT
jgi:hypothetical protein